MAEQPISDHLFDSLMVYSEGDFLDSVGLDFNLIKDASRMVEMVRSLSARNTNYSPLKIPGPESLNSKEDISVLISTWISYQL